MRFLREIPAFRRPFRPGFALKDPNAPPLERFRALWNFFGWRQFPFHAFLSRRSLFMSMTQTLAPHLPYLRRYARALTGSQQSGDAHVRAALQALLTGDEALAEGVPPRVGLYRLFHAIWQSGAEHYDEAGETTGAKSPENRLRALSASKRAALLLTAVEAFSPEEAAFIIDESPEEVEKAILDAQKTIDTQLASRVLIIEDEPIIAMDLENLVTELGHKVVAVASTKDEAVAKAPSER